MTSLRSCILLVVVYVSFCGTARKNSQNYSTVTAANDGGNTSQPNNIISIETKIIGAYLNVLSGTEKSFLLLQNATALSANSTEFKHFEGSLNDFYSPFQSGLYNSATLFDTAVTQGLVKLRVVISNGWNLVDALLRQKNPALANRVAVFLAELESLLDFGENLPTSIQEIQASGN